MTNPDQEASDQAYLNDEIDLKELFTVLWDGKLVVLILTSLAALVSVMVAMSLPNIYTANALLAPADGADNGMSSYLNQILKERIDHLEVFLSIVSTILATLIWYLV